MLQASLGQGLFSDPIDKTITSFVVYIILLSLSSRVIARFPLGDRLLPQAAPAGRRAGCRAGWLNRPRLTGLPDFVSRPPEGFYRSLNPFTKLIFALAMTLIAFGVRGWIAPAIVLAIGLAIVAVLGLARRDRAVPAGHGPAADLDRARQHALVPGRHGHDRPDRTVQRDLDRPPGRRSCRACGSSPSRYRWASSRSRPRSMRCCPTSSGAVSAAGRSSSSAPRSGWCRG